MSEDPFKNRQERLDVRVELAKPEDWQEVKRLRLESITGPSASMFGLTSEKTRLEIEKDDAEWIKETASDTMFSVLAWKGSKTVGLGRVRLVSGDVWWLRNDYVVSSSERMGLHKKMIALRLREIIEGRKGVKAGVGIEKTNDVSLNNYKYFGFSITDEDDFGYSLELDLTQPKVINKINEVLNAE